MRFLSSHGIAPPRGFRLAAELALNTRLRRALEEETPDPSRLSSVLEEARDVGISLHEDGLALAVELALERLADGLRANPAALERLEELEAVVDLARQLPFEVDFWKVAERLLRALEELPARPGAGVRRGIRGRAAMARALPFARAKTRDEPDREYRGDLARRVLILGGCRGASATIRSS